MQRVNAQKPLSAIIPQLFYADYTNTCCCRKQPMQHVRSFSAQVLHEAVLRKDRVVRKADNCFQSSMIRSIKHFHSLRYTATTVCFILRQS